MYHWRNLSKGFWTGARVASGIFYWVSLPIGFLVLALGKRPGRIYSRRCWSSSEINWNQYTIELAIRVNIRYQRGTKRTLAEAKELIMNAREATAAVKAIIHPPRQRE